MPALGLDDIFGTNFYSNYDTDGNWYELVFVLNDFQNEEDGGEITGGLGITDLPNKANNYVNGGNAAANMLYALLLHLKQAQAANRDDDPEQRIHVSEGGVQVVNFGNRQGQLKRDFIISFFSTETFDNSADIDAI